MASPRLHWITLWDEREWLGWYLDGLSAFRFGCVPSGLATRRQLRARGLCPGGKPPYGLIIWRSGRRFAYLYRVDLAKPSRQQTPAQQAALDKAMAARRHCTACDQDAGYCVPTSTRICWTCELGTEAA
jgi:hypothetical protein